MLLFLSFEFLDFFLFLHQSVFWFLLVHYSLISLDLADLFVDLHRCFVQSVEFLNGDFLWIRLLTGNVMGGFFVFVEAVVRVVKDVRFWRRSWAFAKMLLKRDFWLLGQRAFGYCVVQLVVHRLWLIIILIEKIISITMIYSEFLNLLLAFTI